MSVGPGGRYGWAASATRYEVVLGLAGGAGPAPTTFAARENISISSSDSPASEPYAGNADT